PVGSASAEQFQTETTLGVRRATGSTGPDSRREIVGRSLRGVLGAGGEAGARSGQFHARSAHGRARLHGGASSVHGELRVDVWHGAVAKICAGPVSRSAWRKRSVANSDSGSSGDKSLSR